MPTQLTECRACSKPIPAESRFCPACGAPQDGAPVTGGHHTIVGGSSILTDSGAALAGSSAGIDHGQFVPGTILSERYRIVGRLGRGGMGEVYRADDLKLGTSVALKFLPRRLTKREDRLERFHGEVRLARQIAHPNVCRVFDINEFDGQPFITMEYVDGEDLSSLLRRIGRLPRDKGLEIARQLCSGMAAAHERGILHRDLKPANIMIDGRGHVRVTDFGLAALADDTAGENVRAGTPGYMAPEQLLSRDVSVRSDIYALGLVLYEIFTGKRAHDASTIEDLKRAHSERMPAAPSSLVEGFDAAIERVIMHCLERDPRERPTSMMAVLAAFPGGDPLAAALAAGELPSPELVAAAAHAEGMPPSVCLACFLVILIGILAFPFLNDQIKLHASARLHKSPEVLVDRARNLIRKLDWPQAGYSDYGFSVNHAYLTEQEQRTDSASRWSMLSSGGPSPIEFWYRQSPQPLAATNDRGIVTETDPPLNYPGMVAIRLDPEGALAGLLFVPTNRMFLPTSREALDSQPAEFDWSPLFVEADLSIARFQPIQPRWVPPVPTEQRFAWRGVHPANPEAGLRIEGGLYAGRPVFFRVSSEWVEPGFTQPRQAFAMTASASLINVALFAAALIGASLTARRNWIMNRGDRRGALRISVFVGAATLANWLLQADHIADAELQLANFGRAAGRAMFMASLCWLFYIALEPHLRRRWPDMLISWSRLLRGRYRDPLVGRDILIGGLFGIFGMVATALRYFGPWFFGGAPPRPASVPESTLLGLRYDIAELLNIATNALFQPMLVLVVLLVLLVILRQRSLALIVFYILVTWQMTRVTIQAGGNPYINLAFYGLIVWALLFVLMRFGLLALMFALLYVLVLDSYPITADVHAWYRESSWFALAVVGALTVYGYLTALAGRPILMPAAYPRDK